MVPPGPSVVHLRLVQPVSVDPAGVRPVLEEGAQEWLGSPVEAPAKVPGSRRFLTDLSLPVRGHAPKMVFRKAAYVDLGPVRDLPDGLEVAIGWRSSTLAPLFPVFAGTLAVTPRELRLEGYYAPPGGEVGLVLDKAFLNIAARGTARWLLAEASAALQGARRDGHAPPPAVDSEAPGR